MGPEGIILVNPPITTFQQSLTHSALRLSYLVFYQNKSVKHVFTSSCLADLCQTERQKNRQSASTAKVSAVDIIHSIFLCFLRVITFENA